MSFRCSTLIAFAFAIPIDAQQSLPFSDGKWELHGDSTRLERIGNLETLRMENGSAFRRDVALQDGIIDADVMVTRRRSFVYLNFRMQSDEDHEEFYLRPHKSTLPDATQYSPVYQGQSAWQLYYGARGTAAIEIEPNVWKRLRIILSGSRAAFFFGDTIKPFMVIPHLAREPRPGYIELTAFVPPGTPGSGAIAHYANVRIRPGPVAFDFALPSQPAAPTGTITAWEIGEAFAAPDSAISSISPSWIANMKRVLPEPEGFVELHRFLPIPKNARYWGTVARVRVFAQRAETKRFDLGFSDRATVFLNGKPIFYRDDSYDFERRRDGLIASDQATVYLPLRAGENDLSIVVTDRFGGWAIMGRFPEMTGLRIEPSRNAGNREPGTRNRIPVLRTEDW